MDVLVLDSDGQSGQEAQHQLEAAGHRVWRCHESGAAAFACAALDDPHACPLDGDAVDAAVVVRGRPSTQPTAFEDGVACSLRHRVPLVVAGSTESHPYEHWATAIIAGTTDVVAACEGAASARLGIHEEGALEVLRATVDGGEALTDDAVVVRRQRGTLVVEIHVGGLDGPARSLAAARVAVAIRAVDPYTARMTIGVVDGE
jgi:hypothetical protein